MTGTRRNILSMSPTEVQRLTSAFNVLKANGVYDEFIRNHVAAMNVATPPGSTRNAAHRAPAFLPWHRATLLDLENALQAVDPSIEGMPYWRWQNETELNGGDPRRSALWSPGGIGTDGDRTRGNRVLNGPFAHWTALIVNNSTGALVPRSQPGLIRLLGRDPRGSTRLPDRRQVTDAIDRYATYDRSPWDASVATFRNRMEGWSAGPRMHNLVHRWVGGDMLAGTSPNDPVFWLTHANVDRLWWVWQGMRGVNNYQPTSGGPTGHNLNDSMQGLVVPRTPADVLDINRLDYSYA